MIFVDFCSRAKSDVTLCTLPCKKTQQLQQIYIACAFVVTYTL